MMALKGLGMTSGRSFLGGAERKKWTYTQAVMQIEQSFYIVSMRKLRWRYSILVIVGLALFLSYKMRVDVSKHKTHKTSKKTLLPVSPECAEDWPVVDIFLPVPLKGGDFRELAQVFLPSLALFWPLERSHSRLLILTDGESKQEALKTRETILQLADSYNIAEFTNVTFTYINENIKFDRGGHDRQQLLMFWAENYTRPEAEYVAFVDTDSYFVSPVMLSDVFTDGLPIARPLFGKTPDRPWFNHWPYQSQLAIGRKEPFVCMSYFPVTIKISHLAAMREHIRRQLSAATFNRAFEEFSKISNTRDFSQFNMMCSYMWWHLRDEYSWQIAQLDPYYRDPPHPARIEKAAQAEINTALLRQTPRVTTHKFDRTPESLVYNVVNKAIVAGICYSSGESDQQRPLMCSNMTDSVRSNQVNQFEWIFEQEDYAANYSKALEAHQERLRLLDKCPDNRRWIQSPDSDVIEILVAKKVIPNDL